MADVKVVTELDLRLMEEGIIDSRYKSDYGRLHRTLNTKVRSLGKRFTEETFSRAEGILRTWLAGRYRQGESQEKLTSCLRCGLAHLSYDLIEAYYDTFDTEYLATRAYASFKKRDYHRTHFMASSEDIEEADRRKTKGESVSSGPAAVKKTGAGKTSAVKSKTVKSRKKTVSAASKKGTAKTAGAAADKKESIGKRPTEKNSRKRRSEHRS